MTALDGKETGTVVPDEHLRCDCGATRRNPATLRVHKWIAHGEQQS